MVRATPVSKQKLLNALIAVGDFPEQQRPNVARGGKLPTGFAYGLVKNRPYTASINGHKFQLSRFNSMPKYKEVGELAFKIMEQHNPQFKFTTIQFNKNNRTAKHKDSNNVGESYILGLGDYEGGELIVFDEDGRNPKKVNINNRFFKFNGSTLPHETAPFRGERFTMVFFNVRNKS